MKEILSKNIKGTQESKASCQPFSEQEIKAYAEGCQLLGENLSTVVDNVISKGRRPTILIPSRGAVPIFLLALDYLRVADSKNRLIDPSRTEYYPGGIFPYLSGGKIQERRMNGSKDVALPDVDVVLYPFTADVSSASSSSDGRELSRILRRSCARATVDLFYGDKTSLDLKWNAFLLGKMNDISFDDFHSSPQNLIKTLHTIAPSDRRQIILVDTVISGRASTDISEAFANLGHPVVPVLAIDTSRGEARYQKTYKDRTQRACFEVSGYFDHERSDLQEFEFPLISEDNGAALLGVSALNFRDFNRPNIFHKADERFAQDFMPQSCLWTIPPRNYHVPLFQAFLERCAAEMSGNYVSNMPGWLQHADGIRQAMRSRSSDYHKYMKGLIKTGGEVLATDTSSHIISVGLEQNDVGSWIREFSRTAFDA